MFNAYINVKPEQTPRILTEKNIFARNPSPGHYMLFRIPWVNLGGKSFLTYF
jgi:hypothetical protein